MKFKIKIAIILSVIILTAACAIAAHIILDKMNYEDMELKNYYYDMLNIVASDSES